MLQKVCDILNSHYDYNFYYKEITEGLYNIIIIYKDEKEIINIRTMNNKEGLLEKAFVTFIRYIANDKEIYKRHKPYGK